MAIPTVKIAAPTAITIKTPPNLAYSIGGSIEAADVEDVVITIDFNNGRSIDVPYDKIGNGSGLYNISVELGEEFATKGAIPATLGSGDNNKKIYVSYTCKGTTVDNRDDAPTITVTAQPATITGGTSPQEVTFGYTATESAAYTLGGTAPTASVTAVTPVAAASSFSFNNTSKKLEIAAGLAVGDYTVTLTPNNTDLGNGTPLTFTLTVNPAEITSVNAGVTAPAKGGTPDATTATGAEIHYTGAVSWDPTVTTNFLGETVYTATAVLTADTGYVFATALGTSGAQIGGTAAATSNLSGDGKTLTLTRQYTATAAKEATGIAVKYQPSTLSYTDGGTLDLAGLVVTITYDEGAPEDVAYASFSQKDISASPDHGATLALATHNGTPITVSLGALTANTSNLTVSAAPATITGTETKTLTYGYTTAEAAIAAYTVTGTAPITVAKGTSDAALTWNDTTRTLTIATGLAVGDYSVTLTPSNAAGDGTPLTFTLTVEEAEIDTVTVAGIDGPSTGGTPDTAANNGTNYTAGAVTWAPTVASKFLGTADYTATVVLTAANNYVFAAATATSATISGAVSTSGELSADGKTLTLTGTYATTGTKAISAITINTQPTKLTYVEGETLSLAGLVVHVTYDDSSSEDVAFANFGTKGISVSLANGTTLTNAMHDGQAITVSSGSASDTTSSLTVSLVSVTGVSVSPASRSIAVGGTAALTATVQPTNASNKAVAWSSDDTGVATVSSTGVVTAVAEGTANITATTDDGSHTSSSAITVTAAQTNNDGDRESSYSNYVLLNDFGTYNGTGTVSARIGADYDDFIRLEDERGNVIPRQYYTVTRGSTIITFTQAYLNTLAKGTYSYAAYFIDGVTRPIYLTVGGSAGISIPRTGDEAVMLLPMALLLGAALCLLIPRRKERD
ncbi:MAG: Ig-like domain-containing protein [Christensenellaceae bacterium]|nr:Ig-like domain-containing protein [Christensenellaceae bacterium]